MTLIRKDCLHLSLIAFLVGSFVALVVTKLDIFPPWLILVYEGILAVFLLLTWQTHCQIKEVNRMIEALKMTKPLKESNDERAAASAVSTHPGSQYRGD